MREFWIVCTSPRFAWSDRHVPILGAIAMINNLACSPVVSLATFLGGIEEEAFKIVPNRWIHIVVGTSVGTSRKSGHVPLHLWAVRSWSNSNRRSSLGSFSGGCLSFCCSWKYGGRNFRAVVNYDAIISIVMITAILGRFEYETCNIEPYVGEHAIVRASVGSSRLG
jgi:hypothetical protein